jgi:glycosyltransferase involved in cell wall biosynthesis
MKILLVAPHYPPRFIGGVERIARRLAHRLRAAGHAPTVVAVERLGVERTYQRLADVSDDDGVTVWRLSLPREAEDAAFASTYRPRGAEAWLRDWIARERPDVIHLHSGYLLGGAVLEAAAAHRIPVAVTLHDYWFICPRITLLQPDGACCTGPESARKCAWCLATEQRRYRLPQQLLGAPIARAVGRALAAVPSALAAINPLGSRVREVETRQQFLLTALSGAAAIMSPSRFLRDQVVQAGVPRERIALLPYGIEPGARVPPRVADDVALRVGFLGQVAPHKGLHVLIPAVRALRERRVELIIRGDLTREPAYVASLRALTAGDPRIVFAGPIVDGRVDAFFGAIDVLAVPSVWYENAPLVMLEAKRAGVPVLASRLGGMAELVRHDVDGLLAEPGSPAAFAGQLERLIAEPALLDRLRQGITPPGSIDDELRALLDLYANLAARKPGHVNGSGAREPLNPHGLAAVVATVVAGAATRNGRA